MKKKKDFKVVVNYVDSPAAQDRLFQVLKILVSEEDLLENCTKKSAKEQKIAKTLDKTQIVC